MTKFLAAAVGGVAGLVPLLSGLFVAADPLRRRRGETESGGPPFVKVTSREAIHADGKPKLFRVIVERKTDAWNTYLDVPIGAVYLIMTPEKPDEVIAFNTTCPHKGCFVETSDTTYHCPCHKSEFNADGSRGAHCVSPRGLDRLETKIENGEVWVRYQDFETGKSERVPV